MLPHARTLSLDRLSNVTRHDGVVVSMIRKHVIHAPYRHQRSPRRVLSAKFTLHHLDLGDLQQFCSTPEPITAASPPGSHTT